MRRWPVGLATWLLVLAVAQTMLTLMVVLFFVRTRTGQLLDTVALTGNSIGQVRTETLVDTVLNAISALSLAVATAVVGFIALIRRRITLAVGALLLIAGANLTTQVLKHIIYRPNLGIDPQRLTAGNSLPSGHTTIVASVAVALVLVLPTRQRGGGAIIGALFASVAGVATLSAGWHRPSDAVAALLVVGAWAAGAGLFIIGAQPGHGGVRYGPSNRHAVVALAATGVVLLAGAVLALASTDQIITIPADELGRRRLFVAYAGGALGIAGTCALVVGAILATAHRVVPAVVAASVHPTAPAPDPAAPPT